MVKKCANIFIITFAVHLFILTKTVIIKNEQMLMMTKITEVFSCGIIAWLFSKLIHQRVNNGILRVLFMFLFGAIIYAVPTYVKIFTWCCRTSELSIITQISVSNYIFLNRIFDTYILQTGFWIVFYSIIYILGGVRNSMKLKRYIKNEEALDGTKVNYSYEYFIDNIMNKQQSQNTKFAVRLRNEGSFYTKVYNAYSKIDLEAIKKEMGIISDDSCAIFEIGKFDENEKLVARLCIDMRGQPIHWEVLHSEV